MESPPNMGAPVVSHGSGSESGSGSVLGFHLGIALLLVAVFTLTGIFSCYYHWDRIRRSVSPRAGSDPKPERKEESLTVIMPGDEVPKFIALTCPLQPPRRADDFVVEVPPPPPRKATLSGVPFYTLIGPY